MNQIATITVTSLDGTVLYSQIVEGIDLLKLTQLVNTPPPEPPKPKKKRSDAGKPRARVVPILRPGRIPTENELASSGQP